MRKYRPNEPCAKCGDDDAKVHFGRVAIPPFAGTKTKVEDVLTLTCRNCGYNWDRAPLDAEEGGYGHGV